MNTRRMLALFLCLGVCTVSSLAAASVQRFSVGEMVTRADSIFRGRVVSVEPGELDLAGGTLRTTTVVFEVEEPLKGGLSAQRILTLAGSMKPATSSGPAISGSLALGQPHFELEGTYVVFATQPSRFGLSTAVGLGQGAFTVLSSGDAELVVNELGNAGLLHERMTYDQLRRKVLEEVAP